MSLTHKRLRELLHYDQDLGWFMWLADRNQLAMAGSVAGKIGADGYARIKIDGREFLAHRLAFFYVAGRWPADQIDHRDGQRANNSFDNLREATRAENLQNQSQFANNNTGVRGVYWITAIEKFRATITHRRKLIHLYEGGSLIDAVAARRRAEWRLFTHHRSC